MRLVPALLLLAAAVPAAAKNISITVTPAVQVSGGTVTVRLKVSNGGDEAAQSVLPVLRFRDKEKRGTLHASLGPNESFEETLALEAGELGPGRWPFRVTVDYTDANQYPFQALQVISVISGTPTPAKLSIPEVKAAPLSTSGSLAVHVKNLSATPRTVSLEAYVPEGLEVSAAPPRDVQLAAWADDTVPASLLNRTALPGSRYPIYVVAEYDDEGTHQMVLAQGIVDIVEKTSFLQRQRNFLWIGAAVLAGLWLLVAVFRVVTRPRARAVR